MAEDQQTRLAVELEYYARHKAEWLAHKTGLYVVVKDSGLLGFYPNFEAAYRAGAAAYGLNKDFLVKQILEHEPVFFVY
jgi:RecB family exonuclease